MILSAIVPVHNGGRDLEACIRALVHSSRPPDQLLVIDDASTDGSAELAESLGAEVIRLQGSPHGPAVARNRAAALARGDVLVFIDADVVVHDDTLALIESHLRANPDVVGLFGSYDDRPAASGLVSRYKNLMHHYVHQHGAREAATFWSGCGAMRRAVFLDAGGFLESFARPSVEDIELGMRLRAEGRRIWLCPEITATHLKRWTFRGLLYTDIFCRAVPWAQLIVRRKRMPSALNLDWRNRLSALLAWLTVTSLVAGAFRPLALALAALASPLLLATNWGLYTFFRRKGGIGFAIASMALHILYLLYSSATLAVCVAGSSFRSRTAGERRKPTKSGRTSAHPPGRGERT